MVLTPSQAQIAKDTHRFRVVCCGRQFGKTTLAALEMIGFAIAEKNRRVVYIATTFQQARDILWKDLLTLSEGAIKSVNETRLEVEVMTMDGGVSLIVLRGWENIETARGTRNHFIVLDEVSSMRRFWEQWEEVLMPTLAATQGQALFLSTPKGFNAFHELFEREKTDKDFKSFHFTSYDNPHLSKEWLDERKAASGEDRFAQEYLADFRKVSGLIWNLPDNQVIQASNAILERLKAYPDRVVAGVDWGFHHPTAIVVAYVKDAVYYILDEWGASGKTTAEIVEVAKQLAVKHKISMWYPDPAEPDRIEELKRAGLKCGDTNKDVALGLSHVADLVRKQQLYVIELCTGLLSEMDQYQWDKTRDGFPKEAPVKDHHFDKCDALRYLTMGHRAQDPKRLSSTILNIAQNRRQIATKNTYD